MNDDIGRAQAGAEEVLIAWALQHLGKGTILMGDHPLARDDGVALQNRHGVSGGRTGFQRAPC
jgi:hypothetical protein